MDFIKMEKIAINPQRLHWCLRDFGITLEALSKKLRFQIQENNEGILISIKQLEKIAKYFDQGLLFFLNPKEVVENKIHSFQFRTINSQKNNLSPTIKKLIKRVEIQRERYLGLLEDLSIPLKKDWNPKFTLQDSHKVRQWLNLDQAKSFEDIRKAIEDKGILVLRTNGYAGAWQIPKSSPIRGFSLYYESLPIIVVKKEEREVAQNFTLIHELGHLLLHSTSSIDDENDFYSHQGKEKEANQFAGEVLVPQEAIKKLTIPPALEISEYDAHFEKEAKKYCVSVEVLLRRLLTYKKISEASYNDYREYKSKATLTKVEKASRHRHREPLHIFGKPFVSTVLSAYYEKHITLARASSYLDNLKISDVHKLEASRV